MSSSGQTLSSNLLNQLNESLKALYTHRLLQAKTCFNNLLTEIEREIGSSHFLSVKWAKRLIFHLRDYESHKDACWLLDQVTTRCPQAAFKNFLLTQSILPGTVYLEWEETEELKRLIVQLVTGQIGDLNVLSHLSIDTEEKIYYATYAYVELAFLLFRKKKVPVAISYLKKALEIVDDSDPELSLLLSFYILKYQTDCHAVYDILIQLEKLLVVVGGDHMVPNYAFLRQLFIYVSDLHEWKMSRTLWYKLNSVGKKLLISILHLKFPTMNYCYLMSYSLRDIFTHLPLAPFLNLNEFVLLFTQLLYNMTIEQKCGINQAMRVYLFDSVVTLRENSLSHCVAKMKAYLSLAKMSHRIEAYHLEEDGYREVIRLSSWVYGPKHFRNMKYKKYLALSLFHQGNREEYARMIRQLKYSHYKKSSEWKSYVDLYH